MSDGSGMSVGQGGGGFPYLIGDLIHVLKRRALLILLMTALATGGAMLFALSLPNRFEAVSTILIDPRTKKIVDIENVLSGIDTDTPTIESEVEIILSRAIAGRVIDKLDLARDPEFLGMGLSPLDRLLGRLGVVAPPSELQTDAIISATAFDASPDEAVFHAFADRLSAWRRRNTFLIEIHFESESSVKSARIATAVAEAYLEDQVEAKSQAAEVATVWLERRLGELRAKLQRAEADVAAYQAQNDLVMTEGHSLDEKELARLMEQLTVARGSTAAALAKYRQVEILLENPGSEASAGDVLDSNTVATMRAEYGRASRRVAELKTRYGSRHPTLQQARAEEADARGQLMAEIQRIVASMKSDYEVARSQEGSLASKVRELRTRKITSNTDTIDLRQLQHEADAARAVYDTFLRRYRETTEQRGFQLPDARVVERASVPSFPSSPQRKKLIAAGVLGGLFLSLMLALALEFLFPSIMRAQVVQARSGLRHLGQLPSLMDRRGVRRNLTTLDDSGRDAIHDLRLCLTDPRHPYCAGVRDVRNALDRARTGDTARLIMVTGVDHDCSQALLASNLAHQYAVAGLRTLLVDGNLEQSELTRILLPHHRTSLLDVLAGTTAIDDAIVTDGSCGLSFMPAIGQVDAARTPFDPFGSVFAAHVLDALRDRFDVVVARVGGLASDPNTLVFAGHAQQVVPLTVWSNGSVGELRQADRLLENVGLRTTGVVIDTGRVAKPLHAAVSHTAGGREFQADTQIIEPVQRVA